MRLLLDTHAFLWWVTDDKRLPQAARRAIADDGNDVFVSATTAWEIAIKHGLGKLPEADALVADIAGTMGRQGFEELPIAIADAMRAGALPTIHGDPFDRMLIAQALSRDLVVISNESIFDRYGVRRVW